MKGLLVKDFKIISKQKNFMITIIVVSLIFGLVFKNPGFINSYLIFMASMYVLGTISYDEFDNGMPYLLCLPYSKKQYVLSKYLLTIITTFVMAIFGSIMMYVVAMINGLNIEMLDVLISVVASFIISLFLIDFMIPVRLKYGIENSRVAIFVVYGILFAIGFFGFYIVDNYCPQCITLLENVMENNPYILIVIIMMFILFCTYISYKISNKIIEEKEY